MKKLFFSLTGGSSSGPRLGDFRQQGKAAFQLAYQAGGVLRREVPRQAEGVGALPQLPQHLVFFRPGADVVRRQQQLLPLGGQAGDFPQGVLLLLARPADFLLQRLGLLGRGQGRGYRRIGKPHGAQRLLHLGSILPQAHQEHTGLLGLAAEHLRLDAGHLGQPLGQLGFQRALLQGLGEAAQ